MTADAERLGRHIVACNNAVLPGGRLALRLDSVVLGWVPQHLLPVLSDHGMTRSKDGGFDLRDTVELHRLAAPLAEAGHCRLRHELFDIVAAPGGASLGTIDRGALPCLGLWASGVHVNGLVEQPDGPYLWVGRRADDKALDPGKLDHLVAGGIAAGSNALATLAKEGDEECSLPAEWVARAEPVCEIPYRMERAEGLRRDLLHCYDLVMPAGWQPVPKDGEVAEFRLLPLGLVFETVRDTDEFKFNVNLVLIDLFLRRGLIDEASGAGQHLRHGLRGES